MCEHTGLDVESCAHCTGSELDVHDELWDQHDYVDVFSKQDPMDERRPGAHAHNPLAEVHVAPVEPRDVYGRHEAVRLQKRRR